MAPLMRSLVALAICGLLQVASASDFHKVARRNHRELRLRSTEAANATVEENALGKRASNVRFTFFKPGLGACGGWNGDGDAIVALSTQNWDGGSHCGARITITARGRTAQATIVDRCMECPWNALDFSPSLFQHFASLNDGVIYGDWEYGSGAPPPPPPPPPTTRSRPPPTTTHRPSPPPPPPTTSTRTRTTTRSTTNTTPTSSVVPTTTTASTPSAPTFDPSQNVLQLLNSAIVSIAALEAAALNAGDNPLSATP